MIGVFFSDHCEAALDPHTSVHGEQRSSSIKARQSVLCATAEGGAILTETTV